MNADKYKQSAIVSTEIIKGMWQKKICSRGKQGLCQGKPL